MERIYDYIIIGSGSAGSALAYRLGADGKRRILVLEFGGSDAGPLIQMPAALSYPMNMKRYDWGYLAEPEPALGGRRLVGHARVLLEALGRGDVLLPVEKVQAVAHRPVPGCAWAKG